LAGGCGAKPDAPIRPREMIFYIECEISAKKKIILPISARIGACLRRLKRKYEKVLRKSGQQPLNGENNEPRAGSGPGLQAEMAGYSAVVTAFTSV
jgi:hypothetical protein